MADKKISQLTSLTGANTASDDLLVIVDTSVNENKKITVTQFQQAPYTNNTSLFFKDTSGASQAVLTYGSDNAVYFGQNTTNTRDNYYLGAQHIFYSGSSEITRINSVGLGIGRVAANNYKLDVQTSSYYAARFTTVDYGLIDLTNGTSTLRFQNANNVPRVGTVGSYPLAFAINEIEKVRVETSDDLNVLSGNVKINTAAKGVNFTANTPAAGMTSQLLNWYEEGTWTPTQGAGLTVVGAFTSVGRYTRIGRVVTATGYVNGATSVALASGGILCSGLPYNAGDNGVGSSIDNNQSAGGQILIGSGGADIYGTSIAATQRIYFTLTYSV